MRIVGIDHIAVNVKNLEESVKFYRDILGFKQLDTIEMDDGFSITYMQTPDGAKMELFDYKGKSPEREKPEAEVGLRHLAFQVEDVAEHEKELRAAGVTITLPTCELPSLGVRVLLFLDPNGVTLEFCEKL